MVEGYRPAGSHSAPTADLQAACLRELRHRRSEGEGKSSEKILNLFLPLKVLWVIDWLNGRFLQGSNYSQ